MHKEVFEALSSKPRLDILKQLYRKPLGIQELAEKLKLKPITIRHHIQSLLEADLLESYKERSGTAGRPKTCYKVSKSVPMISFPERKYLMLSNSLIDALKSNLGEEEVTKLLAKIGYEMGKEAIKQFEIDCTVDKWTPDEFQRCFVRKYLEDVGAEPEVVEKTDSRIGYRIHNCIFYELARSKPELMCDVLHKRFHEGIAAAIGNHVKDRQTACMGHGDDYCEHIVEWHA